MAEKTYVMTQAEKEQLEAELEEYKLVRRPEVVERIKMHVLMVTFQKTLSMKQPKTSKPLLKDKFRFLKQKFVMQKSLIVMLLLMTRLQLVNCCCSKKLVQTTKILIISLGQPVLTSSQVRFQMKAQLLKL